MSENRGKLILLYGTPGVFNNMCWLYPHVLQESPFLAYNSENLKITFLKQPMEPGGFASIETPIEKKAQYLTRKDLEMFHLIPHKEIIVSHLTDVVDIFIDSIAKGTVGNVKELGPAGWQMLYDQLKEWLLKLRDGKGHGYEVAREKTFVFLAQEEIITFENIGISIGPYIQGAKLKAGILPIFDSITRYVSDASAYPVLADDSNVSLTWKADYTHSPRPMTPFFFGANPSKRLPFHASPNGPFSLDDHNRHYNQLVSEQLKNKTQEKN